MSVLTELAGKNGCAVRNPEGIALPKRILKVAQETAWGLFTFALFVALGPFSAVAVVMSLGKIASMQDDSVPEPEVAR